MYIERSRERARRFWFHTVKLLLDASIALVAMNKNIKDNEILWNEIERMSMKEMKIEEEN